MTSTAAVVGDRLAALLLAALVVVAAAAVTEVRIARAGASSLLETVLVTAHESLAAVLVIETSELGVNEICVGEKRQVLNGLELSCLGDGEESEKSDD